MYEKKPTSETFCHTILQQKWHHVKPLVNLLLANSSYLPAKSVVSLSQSPVFHFQYSSICDVIENMAKQESEFKSLSSDISAFCLSFRPESKVHYFQLDGVNIFRPHSPTLEGRMRIYKPNNMIEGNKPLGIGFQFSALHWSDRANRWSLPCEIKRLSVDDNLLDVGFKQIEKICKHPDFLESLVINTSDSSYGCARYLSQTSSVSNLVTISRFRGGKKVYIPASFKAEKMPVKGAPKIYEKVYYLTQKSGSKIYQKKGIAYQVEQESIYDYVENEFVILERKTKKGRMLRLELRRWNNLLLRTKKGYSMKEAAFDLVSVKVFDAETGKKVFVNDQFMAISGLKKDEVKLEQACEVYRERFDLEVMNRFEKQNMFMEGFQTPDLQHLDNWMLIVILSCWLLYVSAPDVENICSKWQKYSEPKPAEGCLKSISQVRKGAERLFLTFDQTAFLPRKSKKRKGRQKGELQVKRDTYKVAKKYKKAPV